MRIILIGMKSCGKTTAGQLLADILDVKFVELDKEIEKNHLKKKNEKLTFREIYKNYGENYFRNLETEVLIDISKEQNHPRFVLSCGGGTPLTNRNREILTSLGTVIFIDTDEKILLERILKNGIPAFFPYKDNPEKSLHYLLKIRKPVYQKLSNKIIKIYKEKPAEIVDKILREIGYED